jgi:hypothetical protein
MWCDISTVVGVVSFEWCGLSGGRWGRSESDVILDDARRAIVLSWVLERERSGGVKEGIIAKKGRR